MEIKTSSNKNEDIPIVEEKQEVIPQESLIYIGPSLGAGKVTRFTVYQGGKPKYMEEVFAACPEVEKLFVPVVKLSAVMQEVEKTGTPYHTWYQKAKAYQKGASK